MRALIRLLPLLIILVGCTTPFTRPPASDAGGERAAQAYDRGDYLTAAREYQRLAEQGPAAQRDAHRLRAAEAWLAAGQPERAADQLKPLERSQLTPELAGRRQLVEAKLALEENRIDRALQLLAKPAGPEGDPAYMAELLRLRAEAYQRRNNGLEAARARVEREPLLRDEAEISRNQEAIWQALSQLSPVELRNRRGRPAPDVLSGWMELVAIAKEVQTPGVTDKQLETWRRDYPGHPARDQLIRSLIAYGGGRTAPAGAAGAPQAGRIAVLLPLSGRFSAAGEAVRDGIMAAYYETGPGGGRQIKLYDVGDAPAQVLTAYEQALAEGAQAVIGPLSKEATAVLARRSQFPVPTLMLNYADTPPVENLYQFSLAPDDEARRAAEYGRRHGFGRAAVLTPHSEWGERMRQGFVERWRELGGEVVVTAGYNTNDGDFSEPVAQMLGVESRRKGAQQPREDIQFIFLAATPREARLIRPMLKYYYAGQLPTVATSHVYGGRPNPRADTDLDGVVFEDMPWVLNAPGSNAALRSQVGRQQEGELARLTAFGVDAWNLLPHLRVMTQSPTERKQGETGSLTVDGRNRVVREPVWAQFRRGEPQLIGDAPPVAPTAGQ